LFFDFKLVKMANYFNSLPLREQLNQLGVCEFMNRSEFADGVNVLKGKKIVIVGCGAQGLNQGLNMRDSGLDISYTLRAEAIAEKRASWKNATENGFNVGTYEELIPTADLVLNLTPDKQHTSVIKAIMPLMKQYSTLSYSHGFNIVEEGTQIRKDITVIMVAPKCPGTEVREEYKRGFGVPTLIAVHPENDPEGKGLAQAKAYAAATGGHRAGVLRSSFVAEVKSDLMGEQTILCGVLQTGSILCFDKMVEKGVDAGYAAKFIQYGWEVITEALKHGGVTAMMDRLSNPAKLKAFELSAELKNIMRPLFQKHQDDIMSGHFSKTMMEDWANDDKNLLTWRKATGETNFEKTAPADVVINEQEYFDNGLLMVAFVRAGVELAFETMVEAGIKAESAYYESLHETPLIANTIARKKLFEMNRVISDTAEYGCYLFDHAAKPLLKEFMTTVEKDVIGTNYNTGKDAGVDNRSLIEVNKILRNHPVEKVGTVLREAMTEMKAISSDTIETKKKVKQLEPA
jgi:ketol-acid reductoisomerase